VPLSADLLEYGKEAIEDGALKGSWLAAKRIVRCRPGCSHGYDPVPPADPPKK
jgi:putative component of membrane protein insertase Oxa1/YidC/SpoIIIJ protein YidD